MEWARGREAAEQGTTAKICQYHVCFFLSWRTGESVPAVLSMAHLSMPPIPQSSLQASPGMRWVFSKCPLEPVVMLMGWPHNTQSAKSRLLSLPPPGNFINKSLDLFQEEFQGFSACVCVFPETQQFYMLPGVQTPKQLLGRDEGRLGMRTWSPSWAGPAGWPGCQQLTDRLEQSLCSWLC